MAPRQGWAVVLPVYRNWEQIPLDDVQHPQALACKGLLSIVRLSERYTTATLQRHAATTNNNKCR